MTRRIRTQEYNGNIFFTSSTGVKKIEDVTIPISNAGIPNSLDLVCLAQTPSAGHPSIFTTNEIVRYRTVWGITDANNNLVLGAPSQGQIVFASGATQDVRLTVKIPQYISTRNFLQVYRSKKTTSPALPVDELFLVYEATPTAAEVSAGNMVIEDYREEIILGPPLYTNASQKGIINAYYSPPYCRDIAVFKDCMFYANTRQKQQLNLAIIGFFDLVSGTSTITIGGITYTFISCADATITTAPTGENIALGRFVYYTAIASRAEAIRGTAESLIRVINSYAANTAYYAHYASAYGDTPGQIYLEERGIGGTTFSVTVNAATTGRNFEPQLPVSGTSIISNNDERPNRIYFSEFQQPEAVPLVQYFQVGAQDESIQRILALRDSLIILKERSIWRITGTSKSSFSVSTIDNTVVIGDRYDSAAVLNNRVMCLTNQGVVAISDTGVQIISRAEEFNLTYPTINGDGFSVGIGHEQMHLYVLCTFDPEFKQEAVDDPTTYKYPYSCYVYNIATNQWARWLINANCFAIYDNLIYYGLNNAFGHVLKQRTYAYDFYDETGTISISAINTTTKEITFTMTPTVNYDGYHQQFGYGYNNNLDAGWMISQGSNKYIVDTVTASNKAILNSVSGLSTGDRTYYRPIPKHVEYSPMVNESAALLKQYTEVVFIGQFDEMYKVRMEFANELDGKKYFNYYKYYSALEGVDKPMNDIGLPLTNAGAIKFKRIRTFVPKKRQMGGQLSVKLINNVACSRMAIKGLFINSRTIATDKVVQ